MFGKHSVPWFSSQSDGPEGTLPVHHKPSKQSSRADQTVDNLEDVDGRPLRKSPFSSLFGNNLPALDDELFTEAKTAQSRPNWPDFFDVPEDAAPRRHAALRSSISPTGIPEADEADAEGRMFYRGGKRRLTVMKRKKQPEKAVIVEHVQDMDKRRKFILKLAKCLLTFGAPSHRIDAQLTMAAGTLEAKASFVHIPDVVIVTFGDEDVASVETHFVKAKGRIALTALDQVHHIYRKVLQDKISAEDGTQQLKEILNAPPIYTLWLRCFFAFFTASTISAIVFGGAIVDMWISGCCAAVLQYLGLNTASKSATYANVYEISVAILVSFVARALSTIPGDLFCYNAISAAGVVLILPGFTILISALELTSRNILCGSVRMVYAIIYTLFLGFGLTIGSDIYLVINPRARRALERSQQPAYMVLHGSFHADNGTFPLGEAVFGFAEAASLDKNYLLRGCYRDSDWQWWRQSLPWWLLPALVPAYCVSSSLSNLQKLWSWQLLVMVIFACVAFAVNKVGNIFLPDNGDLVSAFCALVIGLLGNFYSQIAHGTPFTSMVTGVLFIVPSGIAQGGGLIETDPNSPDSQYSSGFALAIRMIRVAIGIVLGFFASQICVHAFGRQDDDGNSAF